MKTLTVSQAKAKFYHLLDQIAVSHEPVKIRGKRHNAVLISEEDWRDIQETLYLLSVPGMRDSIRKGLKTQVHICNKIPQLMIKEYKAMTKESKYENKEWE